jgi:hypothetical protein
LAKNIDQAVRIVLLRFRDAYSDIIQIFLEQERQLGLQIFLVQMIQSVVVIENIESAPLVQNRFNGGHRSRKHYKFVVDVEDRDQISLTLTVVCQRGEGGSRRFRNDHQIAPEPLQHDFFTVHCVAGSPAIGRVTVNRLR